jgi:hypothetical protein
MWRRRELLGAIGTGAGLALIAHRTALADGGSGGEDPKHAAMMKICGDKCADCAEACNKAFHHCVKQAAAGKPRHATAAQAVADCAAFCALSEQMISRHSTMMALACRACADACRQCAQECESFDTDLDMKSCFDSCQRCEESCREMVKAMGADPGALPTGPGARRPGRVPS